MSRLAVCLLAAMAVLPVQAADISRGEKLHEVCVGCHGTRLYESGSRQIKSLKALRKEVRRWGDYYNPKLTDQDVEDLTAWLNVRFYRFN